MAQISAGDSPTMVATPAPIQPRRVGSRIVWAGPSRRSPSDSAAAPGPCQTLSDPGGPGLGTGEGRARRAASGDQTYGAELSGRLHPGDGCSLSQLTGLVEPANPLAGAREHNAKAHRRVGRNDLLQRTTKRHGRTIVRRGREAEMKSEGLPTPKGSGQGWAGSQRRLRRRVFAQRICVFMAPLALANPQSGHVRELLGVRSHGRVRGPTNRSSTAWASICPNSTWWTVPRTATPTRGAATAANRGACAPG